MNLTSSHTFPTGSVSGICQLIAVLQRRPGHPGDFVIPASQELAGYLQSAPSEGTDVAAAVHLAVIDGLSGTCILGDVPDPTETAEWLALRRRTAEDLPATRAPQLEVEQFIASLPDVLQPATPPHQTRLAQAASLAELRAACERASDVALGGADIRLVQAIAAAGSRADGPIPPAWVATGSRGRLMAFGQFAKRSLRSAARRGS